MGATASDGPQKEVTTKELAYMDLADEQNENLKAAILEARNTIIYSESWCADDMDAFVYDTATGVREDIPKFHDIFPEDWDLPIREVDTKRLGVAGTDSFDDLEVYLKYPSATSLTEPFKTISPEYYIQYWVGANSIPGDSWNFGVTDMTDGSDRLSKTELTPTQIISFSVNTWTTYGLRASTFSTEGNAYLRGGAGYGG